MFLVKEMQFCSEYFLSLQTTAAYDIERTLFEKATRCKSYQSIKELQLLEAY